MIYFRETSINTSELNPDCVLIDTEDADTDTDVNLICNKDPDIDCINLS